MGQRHKTAVTIVLVALVLGIFGDLLFHSSTVGLNALLWVVAFCGLGAFVVNKSKVTGNRAALWLLLPVVVFSLGFAIHDSPGMWLVNFLGVTVSLALLVANLRNPAFGKMSCLEAVISPMANWVMAMVDPILMLAEDIEWKGLGGRIQVKRYLPVIRGLLVAVPLLLVFGVLMSSADAVFKNIFTQPLSFDPTDLITHGGLFAFFAALSVGLMRRALIADPLVYTVSDARKPSDEGATEATVVLGSLISLFGLFVAIQFRYLFGHAQLVQETTGIGYAQYARQGFFELVTISALALPVLLVTTSYARRGSPGLVKVFNGMAGVMVALLGVVMISAVQRMLLYIGAHGLSELRLYTTAFMGWLAIVYAVFCMTSLRGRPQRFSHFAVSAGLGVGIFLNVLSPGRLISDYNFHVAVKSQPLDTDYLQVLGADAVPVMLKALPSLPANEKPVVAAWLQRWDTDTTDWRSFNLSRRRAERLVTRDHDTLALMTRDK